VSEIKIELGNLIAQEVESLSKMSGSEIYDEYIKLTNSTVKTTNTEVTVSSKIKDYDINLRINMEEDIDQQEDEDEEFDEEVEKKVKAEKGESESEEMPLKQIRFCIDVKQQNKEGPVLRIHSIAGKDGKLYFEALEFFKTGKEATTGEKGDVMDFEGLPSEIQDKMCDILDTLHLDDKVAAFVHVAKNEANRQMFLSRMNSIEQLFVK